MPLFSTKPRILDTPHFGREAVAGHSEPGPATVLRLCKTDFLSNGKFQLSPGLSLVHTDDNIDVVRLVRFVKANDPAYELVAEAERFADENATAVRDFEERQVSDTIGRFAGFLLRLVRGNEFVDGIFLQRP